MSEDDAQKFADTLHDPLPGQRRNTDELDPNEMSQLDNL